MYILRRLCLKILLHWIIILSRGNNTGHRAWNTCLQKSDSGHYHVIVYNFGQGTCLNFLPQKYYTYLKVSKQKLNNFTQVQTLIFYLSCMLNI